MKAFNFAVKKGSDGSKHLDLQIHGEIDGRWGDPNDVSTAQEISRLNEHADAKTVRVRINSYGGSAFGGVAMYNALQSHPGEVTCVVEGIAASAASLIAMAGKTRMGVGAMMMIHPPLTMAVGNAAELRSTADVLDKIQQGIGAIYSAKTGKSADEVGKLVNAETWMTADEAVAAGFANSLTTAEAEPEPDPDDPNEGNEPPEDRGDVVAWRGVAFPKAALPIQVLAMAKPRPPVPPVLAVVPPPEPPKPLTRAELALRSPDLVAALLDEGHAAGVAAERARLQAIDELGIPGCSDLVAAAKYGEKPSTAEALAVAVVKAGKLAGAELLALRRRESAPLNGVEPDAPDHTEAGERARALASMVKGANQRLGGTPR